VKDLLSGQAEIVRYEGDVSEFRGQEVKKIDLPGSNKQDYLLMSKDGKTLIAKKEGNVYLEASRWGFDERDGRFGVMEGKVVITHSDTLVTEETIENGEIRRIEGIENGQTTFYILPRREESAIRLNWDGSFDGELVDLVEGDYEIHLEFNEGIFQDIRLSHRSRALTLAEVTGISQEIEIAASAFIEITPEQRTKDLNSFNEFAGTAEQELVKRIGQEKASVVMQDLRQIGNSLIHDPEQADALAEEMASKISSVQLSESEWKSVAEVLTNTANSLRENGVHLGSDGNLVGGLRV
jgi:hypothetical protein